MDFKSRVNCVLFPVKDVNIYFYILVRTKSLVYYSTLTDAYFPDKYAYFRHPSDPGRKNSSLQSEPSGVNEGTTTQ